MSGRNLLGSPPMIATISGRPSIPARANDAGVPPTPIQMGTGFSIGPGRIQELGPVMFSDAERVEANLGGKLDLFQQVLHAFDGIERDTRNRVGNGRCEAVDAELHLGLLNS